MTGVAGTALLASMGIGRRAHADEGGSDGDSIVARLRPEHPRLWATADDFMALKSRIAAHPDLGRWHAQSYQTGVRMLTQPVSEYDLSTGNLLRISRQVRNRTLILAMLYQLDGEDRFAERTWDELAAAAEFPNWYPDHFLSTAEMTHAFAIGYDWLYHYLDREQRDILRDAIGNLGLRPALDGYRHGASWVTSTSNWNLVCNGGTGTGALAVGDEIPELAEEVLQSGLGSLPRAIAEYAPDGAYPEGLNYWAYGTRYLVAYVAAVQTALGDDLGLAESPGLSETGYYPIYLNGPTDQGFNYYDAPPRTFRSPELFWLAKTYDRPIDNWWGSLGAEEANAARYLLWYDPDIGSSSPREAGLPFDRYFRHAEVVTCRSAWDDPRAVFVGFKGGDNQTNHGDLDLGTFVLDALGVRWAVELSNDLYRLPGYFDNGAQGQRWTYYRKRAEGQNTLVVEPGAGPDQDPLATAKIERFESGATRVFAIADLTDAVSGRGVRSWQRGVAQFDHRRKVLVQDEVRANQPVDTWWFMHTEAEITVADDGRSAVLEQTDKHLVARILGPDDATFAVREATPLDSSPDPDEQSANPGVRKLTVQLTGTTNVRLAVLFSPLRRWQEPGEDLPDVEPLADWSIPHPEVPRLGELRMDGEPLEAFTPDVFTYDLVDVKTSDAAPPVVEATAGAGAERVIVHQARRTPGTASIDVIGQGAPRVRYQVHFDWTVTPPFDDAWDFRDQDPGDVLAGREGTPAVLGQSESAEDSDPGWVQAPDPEADGGRPVVLSLDGDDDFVTLTETADIDLSPGFEFEAWIYQRSRTRLPRLMYKGPGGLWINGDGSLTMQALSVTGARARADTVADLVPLNAWTHVGLRYELGADESRFRIYVNGAEATYVRDERFGRGTRLDAVGYAMRLGNVAPPIRGFDGLFAYARLTVPQPDAPQWRSELFG